MSEPENPFAAPPTMAAAKPQQRDGYLTQGILCWASYVVCWLVPWGLSGLLLIIGPLCGAYVLKSAPIRSPARIHAAVGLLLWGITIVLIHVYGMLRQF